jgi:HEAT repeat protein
MIGTFPKAFNRSRMASEGTIPILIEYMKTAANDIVARQYCAMTLGNLAAEPENHMEIVKSDGIDALISVLKSEDVEGGRYAAFALANLAANANHRERIVEEGAVPALVSLACCEDLNAQRQGEKMTAIFRRGAI